MAERGLKPTPTTFTALIKSCGSRPDFYKETLSLYDQMLGHGFIPNLHVYNVLLECTAVVGDLNQAKVYWNEILENSKTDDSWSPNSKSFSNMLLTMEKAVGLWRSRNSYMNKQASSSNQLVEKQDDSSREKEGLIVDKALESVDDRNLPFLRSKCLDPKSIFSEADFLWSYLTDNTRKSLEPTPALTDRYVFFRINDFLTRKKISSRVLCRTSSSSSLGKGIRDI
jgi:pentatricopeptide repeat protein